MVLLAGLPRLMTTPMMMTLKSLLLARWLARRTYDPSATEHKEEEIMARWGKRRTRGKESRPGHAHRKVLCVFRVPGSGGGGGGGCCAGEEPGEWSKVEII